VALTQDMGKMVAALHKIKLGSQSDIHAAIQVAQLALRNRQNKRQEARIVLFVGSPVSASVAELKKIGAALKKNKVAVDIVNFGEDSAEQNEEKLKALHEAVNSHDNSNFVTIPPGTAMLADALHHTKIFRPGGAGPATGGSTGGGAAGTTGEPDFGIDPNMDPELAIALRLSMETAEQERRHRGGADATDNKGTTNNAPSNVSPITQEMEENDPEMAEALRLSLMTATATGEETSGASAAPAAPAATNTNNANTNNTPTTNTTASDPMEEDDEFKQALALSQETAQQDRSKQKDDKEKPSESAQKPTTTASTDEPMDTSQLSPEEFTNLLQDIELPGVDRQQLQELLKQGEEEKKKKDDKKDEKNG